MVGILVFGIVLVLAYIYYWLDFKKRMKLENDPVNIKLRVSKEFQNLALGSSCKFKFKLSEKSKVFYKMKHFEPSDDDKTIIIILEKLNGKEEK